MNSKPTGDVPVDLSLAFNSAYLNGIALPTLSTSQVIFTSANWNIAQTITVTGINDHFASSVPFTITNAVDASTADAAYTGITATVAGTLTNDNGTTAGITVTPTSGLTVTNDGLTTATYTVVLNSRPTADVTIGSITSSDTSIATANLSSLTFNALNWSTPQDHHYHRTQ